MSVIDHLVGIYAPHACVGCALEGQLICDDCCERLTTIADSCYRCGTRSARGRTCPACRSHSHLISVNGVTQYDAMAKDLLKALKFGRARAAGDEIGRLMAGSFGAAIPDDVLLVPVPTARRRVRSRGYDQAELIARSLAKHSSGRYAPLLMRLGSQEQKGADREQRRQQLQGAYLVRNPELVRGARILLVDDVLTTGSTLEEVAATLHAHGAKAVGALVFARVV